MIDSNQKVLNDLLVIARDVPSFAAAQVASGVYIRNRLVALGTNSSKSHPFMQQYAKNPFANFWHAEVRAIFNALKITDDLSRATLFVARARKIHAGASGIARPCDGCWRAIKDYQISRVVYTTDEDNEYVVWNK